MKAERAPGRGRGGRVLAVAALLVAAGTLAGIGWALFSRHGLPPRVVTLATGPAGASYAAYGAKYREVLARHGLEVRLRPTQGDVENLALLRDPRSGVSAAFLQTDMTSAQQSPELVSLGSLFYQPIWLFRRRDGREGPFGGRRVSIGPEGSGTRAIMMKALRLLGIEPREYDLLPLSPSRAADELQAKHIDGMALVAAWGSPIVMRLVRDPNIEILNVARADAFVALDPSLDKLVMPMGVADLARNLPPRDVTLLATKASLVVRSDLHSAVQYLLLEAVSEIHGGPGIFQKAGQFPAAEGLDLPLGDNARRFYRQGQPFLQRYLPFWLAVLVERLAIVLVPVLGILVPLLRGAPVVYIGILESRIARLYGELRFIETDLEERPRGADTSDLAERAARLEHRADHLHVPLYVARRLYTLKQHIGLVQTRLAERTRFASEQEERRAGRSTAWRDPELTSRPEPPAPGSSAH